VARQGIRRAAPRSGEAGIWYWVGGLLLLVDPFLHKNGAGVEVPMKVTGKNGSPQFGLDIGQTKVKKGKTNEAL